MENRYDKVMKNIEVTPEMQDRILHHITHLDFDNVSSRMISFPNYKRYLSIAACFLILLIGTVVVHNTIILPNDPPVQMDPTEGIVEYHTVEELSNAMGFTVTELQDIPFPVTTVQYTSYWGELSEITYTGQNNTVTLRMSAKVGDISGDYSEYSSTKTYQINSYKVTLKGDSDTFRLAVWQHNGFSYAVRFAEGVPVQDMLAIMEHLQ